RGGHAHHTDHLERGELSALGMTIQGTGISVQQIGTLRDRHRGCPRVEDCEDVIHWCRGVHTRYYRAGGDSAGFLPKIYEIYFRRSARRHQICQNSTRSPPNGRMWLLTRSERSSTLDVAFSVIHALGVDHVEKGSALDRVSAWVVLFAARGDVYRDRGSMPPLA